MIHECRTIAAIQVPGGTYFFTVKRWPYSTFHRWVRAGVYSINWGGETVSDVAAGEHPE
jgi:hypothetical protein